MTNQREMEEYVGFTEAEVKEICNRFGRNSDEMKAWYDGYSFLNRESSREFCNAIEGAGWTEIIQSVRKSKNLLKSIWEEDEEAVAAGMECAHYENSILQYNGLQDYRGKLLLVGVNYD